MKFGYDNARRRIIKKYAKLFVVVYGGSGLFLFCLWAWICPVFASRALRCGLWAFWPCLSPVWAPVFILFVARLCTCLFVTHRSFQVIFLQIFSAFFAERGCMRWVGGWRWIEGRPIRLSGTPSFSAAAPLGDPEPKNLFLKSFYNPWGYLFILFTCCRFFGGPRTCSGGHGKPSLYFYKWGWGMGRQLRPLPPPGQQVRQCVRRQAQW